MNDGRREAAVGVFGATLRAALCPRSMPGHTVEVVATLGDGVVAVRHLRAERRSRLTTALIAVGVVYLVVAIAGFLWATHQASVNETARDRWLDRGHPPWAFRPKTLPDGLDTVFVAGGLLGLAALTAGLARRRPRAPDDGIRLSPDGLALELPGGAFVPVSDDTRLRVEAGGVVYHVATVAAPPALERGAPADRRAVAFIAGSALVHLGLVWFLRTPVPPPRTARAEPVAARPLPPGEKAVVVEPTPGDTSERTGVSMDLPGSDSIQRAHRPTVGGFLDSDKLTAIAAITGDADIAAGLGAIDDFEADLTAMGDFGTSLSGFGGTDSRGMIGLGRYSMITETVVPDPGGLRCACVTPQRLHVPSLRLGEPQGCVGDCDKALLRRALKRSIAKLEYCFEKQALVRPDLRGTINARFVLTPDGPAREVTASGVDATVAECIRDVVAQVRFPRFQTVLAITYPMHYRGAGD